MIQLLSLTFASAASKKNTRVGNETGKNWSNVKVHQQDSAFQLISLPVEHVIDDFISEPRFL